MNAPVEHTNRYATSAADLGAAWTFVMEHLEKIGPDPTIRINPKWRSGSGEDEWTRYFEVVVEGMVNV